MTSASEHCRPPPRVLVVDDHEGLRWALRELLEFAGCEVVGVAADGPEGVELARATRPEVVVTDLGLPGFDGVEVARRVRRDLPEVRVVVFTGGSDRDVDRARAAGVGTVLPKSVMPQVLVTAVMEEGP